MEYSGEAFEIEFHRVYLAWLEGGKLGPDPRGEWQARIKSKDVWSTSIGIPPECVDENLYRWKPPQRRTVTIAYSNGKGWESKKLVAPEVDKPKPGEHYAYIRDNKVYEHIWDDFMADRKLLNDGFVFRTRDDAQEMCDWLEACRKHVAFEDVTT